MPKRSIAGRLIFVPGGTYWSSGKRTPNFTHFKEKNNIAINLGSFNEIIYCYQ